MPRQLRVFLCHASQDKPIVRELYQRLKAEEWIDPWLDEEKLIGGQDFDFEINKATRDADAIIVCLSKTSVVKEGYVNKEIRRALDIAQEKGEGAIYVIPLRLDDCEPSFEQLRKLHWVDYFKPTASEKLIKSLRVRASDLKLEILEVPIKETTTTKTKTKSLSRKKKGETTIRYALPWTSVVPDLDLFRFIQIPPTEELPYSFYIGKYPVTNEQYARFINAPDFLDAIYWLDFQKFDANCQPVGSWGTAGVTWLDEELESSRDIFLRKPRTLFPKYWDDENFGKSNLYNPVVGVSWYEASAYCEWLLEKWSSLTEFNANPSLKPKIIRLPLEIEWEKAAGGGYPRGRFPWDEIGQQTTTLKDIARRTNLLLSRIGRTTPVNKYPLGKSLYGVMDMSGNVFEWQANFFDIDSRWMSLRGGSWNSSDQYARVSYNDEYRVPPLVRDNDKGFRVLLKI